MRGAIINSKKKKDKGPIRAIGFFTCDADGDGNGGRHCRDRIWSDSTCRATIDEIHDVTRRWSVRKVEDSSCTTF